MDILAKAFSEMDRNGRRLRRAPMKSALATILVVALAGCCTPWNGPAVITGPAGARLCAKHRIPLVTTRGFRIHMEPGMCVDPDTELLERVERCYPNPVPWYEWLEPGRGGDPTTITYCPRCERGAQHMYK
jgi:hypothetical protein